MFSWKVLWSTVLIRTPAWVNFSTTVASDFFGTSSEALEPKLTVPRPVPRAGCPEPPQAASTARTPKPAAVPKRRGRAVGGGRRGRARRARRERRLCPRAGCGGRSAGGGPWWFLLGRPSDAPEFNHPSSRSQVFKLSTAHTTRPPGHPWRPRDDQGR